MTDFSKKLQEELDEGVDKAVPAEQLQAAFSLSSHTSKDEESEKRFQDFLKEEYRNIATAHLNAGTTINQFFQFYLLIIGIPVTGAGVLVRFGGQNFDIANILASPVTSILAAAIALSGLCMLAHLVNIRLEALHYARAVNGIRKYFYKRAGIDLSEELSMRALPRTITQPRYWELSRFGWIVAAFSILDSVYAFVPAKVLSDSFLASFPIEMRLFSTCFCVIVFCSAHLGVYWLLVRHHERRYLRTHVIGLDIDGVIGNQRLAFSSILPAVATKSLSPDSIARIPLHECETLKDEQGNPVVITEQEEHRVFNRSDYWSTKW